MAVDNPSFNVMKSWGVDVDENILKKCYERLGRRFVPPTATTTNSTQGMQGGEEEETSGEEENRLEFIQADLIKAIEQQKTLYQQQQQNQTSQSTTNVLCQS